MEPLKLGTLGFLAEALVNMGAFDEAEHSFEQLSSVSHRAAAWIAKGDLAVRRGQDQAAAQLYRRAAEARDRDGRTAHRSSARRVRSDAVQ